jgi:hypothetical protein
LPRFLLGAFVTIYMTAMIETEIAYRERGDETTENLLFDEALTTTDTYHPNAEQL